MLSLVLHAALFFPDNFNYPQIPSYALPTLGLILALASTYNAIAFAGFLALTVFYIFFVQSQLGFHPDVSTYSPLLHVAFFVLLWRIFLKKFFSPKESPAVFLICLSFVVGSYYFFPALSKFQISPHFYEWAFYNDIKNMSAATCFYGWSMACEIIGFSKIFWNLLNLGTIALLFIQILSIFFLWGNTLIAISILRIIFHVLVFFMTGDLFAGLIFLNIYLIVAAYFSRQRFLSELLNVKNVAFVLIVMTTTVVLRFQQELGWYDMRISQKYVISLKDRSGKEHPVNPPFWNQYMSYYVYADFSFLLAKTEHPVLTVGTSDTTDFSAYLFQQNLKDVADFKKERAHLKNMLKVEVWENSAILNFTKNYIQEKCVKKMGTTGKPLWLRHYYHSYNIDSYITKCDQLDIVGFSIYMEEGFFNGSAIDVTDRVKVYEHSYF